MAAAAVSLLVTMVALLGGIGVLPLQSARDGDQAAAAARTSQHDAGPSSSTSRSQPDRGDAAALDSALPDGAAPASTVPPADSGTGRRVVFSKSAQRVWLVEADGSVKTSYLVSGSVTDNLAPGRYDVYSRSRWAVGVDDSGTMQYFVRFAHGRHAAIGFHSIPTKHGRPLQAEAELGTPQSHGCIRQKLSDAAVMWDFAGIGTDVVVLA
jgi:lipoprotein-anchoring transpeptidase ErfK/SrfK